MHSQQRLTVICWLIPNSAYTLNFKDNASLDRPGSSNALAWSTHLIAALALPQAVVATRAVAGAAVYAAAICHDLIPVVCTVCPLARAALAPVVCFTEAIRPVWTKHARIEFSSTPQGA